MTCSPSDNHVPRSVATRAQLIAGAGVALSVTAVVVPGVFPLASAGVAIAGIVLYFPRASRAARAGAAAEARVAAVLAGLGSRHEIITNRVIPGLKGRAPEADVIVARADAVFVVEVKHSICPVVLRGSGMECVPDRGPRYTLRDPRPQVVEQVRSVRRFLADWGIDVPVYAVVVVLAPQLTIQGGIDLPVFASADAVRGMIESTRPPGGRGGDPRVALARLPGRDRVRSRP